MPRNLSPKSTQSAVILPATGTTGDVTGSLPFGVYTGSVEFITGAAKQVDYVYKKLGGDIVDIELKASNVYAAYEEAVLEYSYIINLHQGKNILSDALGATTGTFDHKGESVTGPSGVNLKYPRFQFAYPNRIGDAAASEAGFGGTLPEYSASFKPVQDQQDYDLQTIISSAAASGTDENGRAVPYSGLVGNNRVTIKKVFYKTPQSMWRFYGYYGGIGVVGNYSTYGQYSDDSTFEVIPTWQNKMQAIMYEDSLWTRTSHYSYELIDNKLRIFPMPTGFAVPDSFWVKFTIKTDAWEDGDSDIGLDGVNNLNTLPFDNLPYANINAIGKQWIRKYALALCKEMLGQVRGKFTTIPIPGESVTLNHADLLSQAKDEQQQLKEKLAELLETVEYAQLLKTDQEKMDATENIFKGSPLPIFVG